MLDSSYQVFVLICYVWFSPITTLCVIDFVTAVLWFVQMQVCIWTKITCPAMLFLKKTGFLLAAFLNKTLYIFNFFLILLLWTFVFNMLAEAHKVRDMGFGYLQFLWALLSLTLLGCQLPQRLQYCVNTHLKARDHQTVRTSAFSGWQHSVTMN